MSQKFRTTLTALVTPFSDGKVDFQSLEKLVQFQMQNGVKDFVINGTTGESPTVNFEEMKEIFALVKSKTPEGTLLFGTGSNSTEKTKEDSVKAQKLGADAVLVVVPYYNKPAQHGLYLHFKAVASAIEIPVILYNVPGRTITALSVDTIKKLSAIHNIKGIKEASGNIQMAKEISTGCGDQFTLLSGDDGTYAQFLEAGGHGVISVASHILPKDFVDIKKIALEKKFDQAASLIQKNAALIDALFLEANPIPVKMALHWMGILKSPECRLPLTTFSEQHHSLLKTEMKKQGLL
jgi:4-hydroxy-tetrahydrodipicolinate synthase